MSFNIRTTLAPENASSRSDESSPSGLAASLFNSFPKEGGLMAYGTARALGVTIPETLLVRADEVIE